MKKIKFLGTAILAASLLLAGCSSPVDDVVEDDDTTVTLSPEDDGTTSGGGTTTGGNPSGGGSTSGGSNEPVINYTAPDLTGYFKKYLISATETVDPVTMESWDAVSTNTPNADGTLSIVPGTKWGSSTSCVAFTGFEAGSLANYDYIVFTLDTTDFSFKYDEDDADNRNDGVNIKIPEVMRELATKCVINGKKRTYYAQVSSFGEAPINAVQFALIIGGTGTLKIDEVYLAASENPATKAVTGITITPASASLQKNGTQQFTVKDSNYVNRTSEVTYTLSGDAKEGSSITAEGLLTAGTTAGNLTVTATYTVGDKSFTSSATINVLGEMQNLITDVQFKKMYLAGSGWDCYVNNVENVDAIPEDVNFSINEGVISFTTLKDSDATYNTQLFLTTDADLHEGDEWYFSCKIGGVDGTWTVKLNDAEALIPLQTGSFTTEGSIVSFSSPAAVTAANVSENIVLFFAFSPSPAGTITISDIVLTKTN